MKKLSILMIALIFGFTGMEASAQTSPTLAVNIPAEGTINADLPALSWTFYGFIDQVLSFRASSTSGDLDPILTIYHADGSRLIGNDDYDSPNTRDALIEAITIPRSGEYRVEVSAYGNTSGDFVLTMLSGYGTFAIDERFITQGDWQPHNLDELNIIDGVATLRVDGVAAYGLLVNETLELPERHYAEILIDDVSGRNDWAIGMALHYRDPDNYTALLISQRGEWRASVIENGAERILRDWTPHPALVAGETEFRLSALVDARSVTVFYNGLFVGRVADARADTTGSVGVLLRSANAVGSDISAEIDDLFITQPTPTSDGFIFPTELIEAIPRIASQELIRRGIVPAGGSMAWEIAESFLENRAPGVNRLPLIEDSRLANFAVGTTAELAQFQGEGISACGLLFGHQDAEHYSVAYLDNVGGYGLSQRIGDTFHDGIFGINDEWRITETASLILIVIDGQAHFYINGRHVGTTGIEIEPGQIGNVTINFDPNTASCQFRNTWVWQIEP